MRDGGVNNAHGTAAGPAQQSCGVMTGQLFKDASRCWPGLRESQLPHEGLKATQADKTTKGSLNTTACEPQAARTNPERSTFHHTPPRLQQPSSDQAAEAGGPQGSWAKGQLPWSDTGEGGAMPHRGQVG